MDTVDKLGYNSWHLKAKMHWRKTKQRRQGVANWIMVALSFDHWQGKVQLELQDVKVISYIICLLLAACEIHFGQRKSGNNSYMITPASYFYALVKEQWNRQYLIYIDG